MGEILARSAEFFEVMVGLRVSRSWVVVSVLARSADFLGSWAGRRWIAGKILVRSAAYLWGRAGERVAAESQAGRRRVVGGSRVLFVAVVARARMWSVCVSWVGRGSVVRRVFGAKR